MSYLLDTNACINFLQQAQGPIAQRLALLPADEIVLCSVVKMELRYGAERSSRRDENLQLMARFFDQFLSFPFDDQAAEVAGQLRAHLAALGSPIGPNDLLIASIALANGLTLVTHNTREFGRVPGLALEDWESTP